MPSYKLGEVEIKIMDTIGNAYKFKNNKWEEITMEERLNKYLDENNIEINENAEFEMYVVVDASNTDHEIGSIFHGKTTEVYAEDRAYEDLKEDTDFNFRFSPEYFILPFTRVNNNIKQTTIKEDLLTMEDKMFKVLVNRENIVNVGSDIIYVNKYKVVNAVELNPVLQFKIKSIDDKGIVVSIYNSITKKAKTINIKHSEHAMDINTITDTKDLVKKYLETDEKRVALINSSIDDGIFL